MIGATQVPVARKLRSTPDMQRVLDGLIEARIVARSAAEYAAANGYSDAEKIARIEAVKISRASLEIQGNPLRYKQAQRPVDDNAPTPERLARANGYIQVRDDEDNKDGQSRARSRGALRRYQFRSVIDIHADKFLDEHRMAFIAFSQDAELHNKIRNSDLNASGGGSGNGLGGLGNVHQHIRDRHERFMWVSKRLTRCEQEVADVLVTHCITHRNGKPFSLEEFGALIYPQLSDRSFHQGAAVNGVRHLCDHLVQLFHSPFCPKISKPDVELIASESTYDHDSHNGY